MEAEEIRPFFIFDGLTELQLSQLRYVTTSRAAATSLAENYTGYPPLR